MHVVVLGAGYAGVTLLRSLERRLPEFASMTLVNDSPDHLVQHELHRVIRRPNLTTKITIPLPSIADRATVRVGRVESIDRSERRVTLSDGTLSYDVCAICLGAETAYYGLVDVREHAIPLKRLEHANRIRASVRSALERPNPNLVVGGAGLSGVQVAGELAELVAASDSNGSVTVLERFDTVAPGFSSAFSRAVERALTRRDVEVRTGTTITGADETHVTVTSNGGDTAGEDQGDTRDGIRGEHGERVGGTESHPYDVFVWTGGIRGSTPLDGERPTVGPDLRLDDRTFVVGDAARILDEDGTVVPASAQSAVRAARTAATNVVRIVEAADDDSRSEPELEPFSFSSPGWIVSVGDGAVATVGTTVVTGRAAKALKTAVGAGYLSSVGATDRIPGLVRADFDPFADR